VRTILTWLLGVAMVLGLAGTARGSIDTSGGYFYGTFSNVDTQVATYAAWVFVPDDPSTPETFMQLGTEWGGTVAVTLRAMTPSVSGYRLQFLRRWSSAVGIWNTTNDISVNAWHHVAVTYSRSSTSNDPLIYIDGTSVAVTETVAPSGSGQTGVDTMSVGITLGALYPWSGRIAHTAVWSTILTQDEITLLATEYPPYVAPDSIEIYSMWGGPLDVQPGSLTGTISSASGHNLNSTTAVFTRNHVGGYVTIPGGTYEITGWTDADTIIVDDDITGATGAWSIRVTTEYIQDGEWTMVDAPTAGASDPTLKHAPIARWNDVQHRGLNRNTPTLEPGIVAFSAAQSSSMYGITSVVFTVSVTAGSYSGTNPLTVTAAAWNPVMEMYDWHILMELSKFSATCRATISVVVTGEDGGVANRYSRSGDTDTTDVFYDRGLRPLTVHVNKTNDRVARFVDPVSGDNGNDGYDHLGLDLTDAVYAPLTNELMKSTAFAGYTWHSGDVISLYCSECAAGETPMRWWQYVASKETSSTIVLGEILHGYEPADTAYDVSSSDGPMETIATALRDIETEKGNVNGHWVYLCEGDHVFGNDGSATEVANTYEWVHVSKAPYADRADTTLTSAVSAVAVPPPIKRLALHGLQIENTPWQAIDPPAVTDGILWVDGCEMVGQSDGTYDDYVIDADNVEIVYLTDNWIHGVSDSITLGHTITQLARGNLVEEYSDDAFADAVCVINNTIDNQEAPGGDEHPDAWKNSGYAVLPQLDNMIAYRNSATGVDTNQYIVMMNDDGWSCYRSVAIVDNLFDYTTGEMVGCGRSSIASSMFQIVNWHTAIGTIHTPPESCLDGAEPRGESRFGVQPIGGGTDVYNSYMPFIHSRLNAMQEWRWVWTGNGLSHLRMSEALIDYNNYFDEYEVGVQLYDQPGTHATNLAPVWDNNMAVQNSSLQDILAKLVHEDVNGDLWNALADVGAHVSPPGRMIQRRRIGGPGT